jgi:hypothetical protein
MENNHVSDNIFEVVSAIIAAGGNSRAARSLRARQQLRDTKGQWIFMGGRLGFKIRLPNGKTVRVYGQNLGASDSKPGYAQIYMKDQEGFADGFYLGKGDKGTVYKAILSPEQLKAQGIEVKDAGSSKNLQDFTDISPIDSPEGWNKNEDGSYSTEDGEFTIKAGENGQFTLSQNDNLVSTHDDLGEAFVDAADIDAESAVSGTEADKIASLRQAGKKLSDEFAKTTNPSAMDNIEKKIEANDEAVKDIVRNKPIATLTPEQSQAKEGEQPGDLFNLNKLDSAPVGTIIDFKHTVKSADKNDFLVENTYQKNADGKWMLLDNNTDATQTLKNKANNKDGYVGEFRYAEAPKETVAEIPATADTEKDSLGNNVPEGWTKGKEGNNETWTSPDGTYTAVVPMALSSGKPAGKYVFKDNKDAKNYTFESWDATPELIQKLDDKKAFLADKAATDKANITKLAEDKAAKNALDDQYLQDIGPGNDAITRAKNAVARYDNQDGILSKMVDDGAPASDILEKMSQVSSKYRDFRSSTNGTFSKDFMSPEEKKDASILSAIADAINAPEQQKIATLNESPKDLSDWKKVGPQAGSNSGGLYESPTGDRAYVKFQDEAHANNEVLASKLYALVGVKAADVNKGTLDGKNVTYSNIVEGKQGFADELNNPGFISKLQDGFAADAWLANWDVAGLGYENVVVDTNGEPVRIDQGGALQFRAQGAPKGDKFGESAVEVDTLVNPQMNPQSAKVFGNMTPEQKKASAILIGAGATDNNIDETVRSVYGDTPEADALVKKLIARRIDTIARLAPTAPSIAPEVANADFFKEDGSVNQDTIDTVDVAIANVSKTKSVGQTIFNSEEYGALPVGSVVTTPGREAIPAQFGGHKGFSARPPITWTKQANGTWTSDSSNPDQAVQDSPISGSTITKIGDGTAPPASVSPFSTPDSTPAPTMPETGSKNLQDWKDFLLETPEGTTLYTVGPNGNQVVYTKTSEEGWDITVQTDPPIGIKNMNIPFMAEQALQNDLSLEPVDGAPQVPTPASPEVQVLEDTPAPATVGQFVSISDYMQSKDIPEPELNGILDSLDNLELTSQEASDILTKLESYPNIAQATKKARPSAAVLNADAQDNPELTPKSSQDIPNADLILAQIKADYPDFVELSASDIKIAERTFSKDGGKTFKYELVVRRTTSNRFFSYVRETDMATGDVRVWKASPENHSYEALSNKFGAAKNQILEGKDPRNWFQKKDGIEKVPAGVDVSQYNQSVSGEFKFPVSQDDNKNKLIEAVKGLLQADNVSKVMVDALANMGNISPNFADELYTAVIEHQIKKKSGADILAETIFAESHIPHLSFDGVTEVKVGSVVDWTDNKKGSPTKGQVFRGVVQKVSATDISKGYGYTDYAEVIFPEYNQINGYPPTHWRKRTTPGLVVVTGKESKMTEPFVQKQQEALTQEAIIKGLPQGDTAAITPRPKADKAVPSLKATTDTNGNVTVETPTGLVTTPVTPQQSATSLTNPDNVKMSVSASEIQVGDTMFVNSGNAAIGPVSGVVLTTKTQDDGAFQVTYAIMPEAGTGALPIHKSTTFDAGYKDLIKIDVIRPANLVQENSTTPAAPSPANSTLPVVSTIDVAEVVSNIAKTIDTSPSTTNVDTQPIKDLANNAVVVDSTLPAYSDVFDSNKVKKIDFENIVFGKKNAPFSNVASINVPSLQVGDLVKDGVGGNMRYLQILAVEPNEGYHGSVKITYRVISKNTYVDGKIGTTSWSQYMTKKNIKRATPANKDYVISTPGGELDSGNPKTQEKNAALKPVESPDEITAANPQQTEADFLANFGLGTDIVPGITFAAAMGNNGQPSGIFALAAVDSGIFKIGKSDSSTFGLPGTLVKSMDKGSTGIITKYNTGDITVNVSWLSGAKAGYDENLSTDSIVGTKNWLTSEAASVYGVNYDTAPQEAIKVALADKVEALKIKYANEIKQKIDIKVQNDLVKKDTVTNTGSETINVVDVLPWDQSDFEGIDSLVAALDVVQSGRGGVFGREVPIDSGSIEDSKVRVSRVLNVDGTYSTRLEFKLTDWTANDQDDNGQNGATTIAANSPGVEVKGSIQLPKYFAKADGDVQDTGTLIPNTKSGSIGVDSLQNGATYKVPIFGVDGVTQIGYYMLHRANKTSKPIDFQIPKGTSVSSNKSALSYHNMVDIHLSENASADEIEYALTKVGVSAARPATKEDIRVLAENKIINLFGKKQAGAKNYEGELRKIILKKFKDDYGFTASEAKYEQDGSDIFLMMPESFGKKLAEDTGITAFVHSWGGSSTPGNTPEERATYMFNFFTATKIRPTTQRWTHGLNYSGMSSNSDGYGHGAGYIFTRPSTSPIMQEEYSAGNMQMKFSADQMLRRLDFYKNYGDGWGEMKAGSDVLDNLSSAGEVLFKGTVSWSDLARVSIKDSTERALLLEMLLNAGIKDFGGTPIEEVFK